MMRAQIIFVLSIFLLLTHFAVADIFNDASVVSDKAIIPTYFGIHFGSKIMPGQTTLRAQWPPFSFGTVRLWDTYTRWGDVTPRAGEWNFDRIDAYLALAQPRHAEVLYTLGSTPRWASARPDEPCSYGKGCSAEPVTMAHWEEYVRRLAQRYRGQIYAYELWNEPNFSDNFPASVQSSGFYSGSLAQMIEMARIARKVLDEVDPKALLSSPGIVNAPILLNQFLAAGGKQYIQAVSYHFYSGNAEHFARQVFEVRSIMKRHGVGHLPLWNTETGVEIQADGFPLSGIATRTHEEAAARMAQMLILGAATGIERFYYYAWENTRSGLVTETGQHLPGYEAMEKIQKWLLGARLNGCASFETGAVRCDGVRAGQFFIVAWADRAQERALVLPAGWQVLVAEPLFGTGSVPTRTQNKGTVSLLLGQAPIRLVLERVIKL